MLVGMHAIILWVVVAFVVEETEDYVPLMHKAEQLCCDANQVSARPRCRIHDIFEKSKRRRKE